MIFFTADTHFFHENICEYSHRPFSGLPEMTEQLIARWNSVVSGGDIVYVLGDFALTNNSSGDKVDEILQQLKGTKFLVYGNHDRKSVLNSKFWAKVTPYHEIKIDFGEEHKQKVVLCHYAMRVWNQNHRGAWMLHGHSHGNLSDIGGKIVDVGVDVWDYTPVSATRLHEFMHNREIKAYDHHK